MGIVPWLEAHGAPLLWSYDSGLINDSVFSLPGSGVCNWGALVFKGLLSAMLSRAETAPFQACMRGTIHNSL